MRRQDFNPGHRRLIAAVAAALAAVALTMRFDHSTMFGLAPASPAEANEFWAPRTHWRIESGVTALGSTPVTAGAVTSGV